MGFSYSMPGALRENWNTSGSGSSLGEKIFFAVGCASDVSLVNEGKADIFFYVLPQRCTKFPILNPKCTLQSFHVFKNYSVNGLQNNYIKYNWKVLVLWG